VNQLLRIFRLTLGYRKNLGFNLILGWISTFFGLFSLVLVAPLLEIIFYPPTKVLDLAPTWEWSRQGISAVLGYRLQLLSQNHGPHGALLALCLVVVVAILLKNGFHYWATQHSSVVVNRSTQDLRNKLFKRVLTMPLGFLTDNRKGELLARLSNDVQDIEFSMLSVVTAFFRHPLHIATYVLTLLG